MSSSKITIKTERSFGADDWCAYDDNTYDGPGSVIGWGATREEAIAAFKESWEARYDEDIEI